MQISPDAGMDPQMKINLRMLAAYGFIFMGGIGVELGVFSLFLGMDGLGDIAFRMGWLGRMGLLSPGLAAMLGAAAVHRPYLRKVHEQNIIRADMWMVAGVLIAHLAFMMLNFVMLVIAWPERDTAPWPYDHHSKLYFVVLTSVMDGVLALILGGIPDLLFGLCFTRFLFWRGRR